MINNVLGTVSLATLLSNHRVSKDLRIGFRIGSLFYFYNQYKHVDKLTLNYYLYHPLPHALDQVCNFFIFIFLWY